MSAGVVGSAIPYAEVDHLIEIRGVYDGWSIAVMKDGTWRNRWAGGQRAYLEQQTDAYIAAHGPKGDE